MLNLAQIVAQLKTGTQQENIASICHWVKIYGGNNAEVVVVVVVVVF